MSGPSNPIHRRWLRAVAAAALVLPVVLTTPSANAAPDAGPSRDDVRSPHERARGVIEHWDSARRARAVPRDRYVDVAPGVLRARPAPAAKPDGAGNGGGGGGSDTTPPAIGSLEPAEGASIGAAHEFSAVVTDESGVKSVSFVVQPPAGPAQSFAASHVGSGRYAVALSGFSDGAWSWYVEARDTAKRGGNVARSETVVFSVVTPDEPGEGDDVVADADWNGSDPAQTAVGRIYFEMPTRGNRWGGYVCSGSVVTDGVSGRSVVLTAAHCVYDDARKVFARNVLFIPDQAATSGSGTDTDCGNDPHGCWAPAYGVVDDGWAERSWPDNIPWDYGFYVVDDSGAHSGAGAGGALDGLASLDVAFSPSPSVGVSTAALGYSYSMDPRLRYCQEPLAGGSATYGGWFLPSCDLSGGASGGPWLQPVAGGSGPVVSVNSYGYSNQPGMGGPALGATASCLFALARTTPLGSPGQVATAC